MLKKIAVLAVCGLMLLAPGMYLGQPAMAAPANATFSVNSTLDEVDDTPGNGACHSASNHCTLRAAVMEANFSSGAGATIIVPGGIYTLTIPASGGDDASTGDLNLTALPDTFLNRPATGPSIQLQGAGAASTIIDANQLDRVLTVGLNRTATISGVTLRDGFVAGEDGGGLRNLGTLTVTNSTIAANTTDGSGGGVANSGQLTLIHSTLTANHADAGGGAYSDGGLTLIQSTVSGNAATGSGGGLRNTGALPLLVDRSTIAGNHGLSGGGITNAFNHSLIVVDSTLSQNYAVTNGGGIESAGEADLYSTTITGNWADSDRQGAGAGGGVYYAHYSTGAFRLLNVLLSGNNLGNTPVWDDCDGSLEAYGTDIVGLEGEPAACTIGQPSGGNLYKLNSLDLLGNLRDNGGPTWTIALLRGSSAIMDGDNPVTCTDENALALATDQRGVVRVLGGNCDIGAFEFLPPAAFLPFVRR